jgi:hypothetical protein
VKVGVGTELSAYTKITSTICLVIEKIETKYIPATSAERRQIAAYTIQGSSSRDTRLKCVFKMISLTSIEEKP